MRIVPVTGDLPALATPLPLPVRHVTEPASAPAPALTPVGRTASVAPDAGATSGDRRPPDPRPRFDPPLIAQRAVLGLPTGHLVADDARVEGIAHAAATAAVDREMRSQAG